MKKGVVATLEGARGLIMASGWTQGEPGDDETGWCAMGAVCEASDKVDGDPYFQAIDALTSALPGSPVDNTTNSRLLSQRNDDAERTKEEVLDLFNRALEATA